MTTRFAAACLLAALLPLPLAAQTPVAPPAVAPVADYAGTISLHVDVSDVDHRLFKVRQSFPVTPGPLTLWYPQWLPGNHAPRGPIEALAGLTITGQGAGASQRIAWTRDPIDPYSFRLVVPEGVNLLDLSFQFLSPVLKEQGRVVATPEIIGLQWNTVVLYPASPSMANTRVQATLTLPPEWDAGTALREVARSGDRLSYEPVSLETLIDSPVFAGRYLRRVSLGKFDGAPVDLHIVADTEAALMASRAQLAPHQKLVDEARALFGGRHFDRYDFLLSLSDQFSGIGLEHHRSSENGVSHEHFLEWDKKQIERSLLPHEFVHSWVGKFRRPAGQMVAHFNTPLRNELLWVYEGQTQYWGQVLAARTGLWSQPFTPESIAWLAATLHDNRPGRDWRTLQDTVYQPLITPRRAQNHVSWQRTEDYYNEGLLIWLDVDTQLRTLTNEARGLDDFARAFFGPQPGLEADAFAPMGFRFEDVVAALNAIAPHDWAGFLRSRLDGHGPGAPLQGLERAGWKLAWTDKPTEFAKGVEERFKTSDYSFSLGLSLGKDADLTEVVWGSPAFKAGLSRGDTLIAVNGISYKPERLKPAVKAAQADAKPIELLLKNLDHYRTVKLAYTGGLRYPVLERIEGTPDRLTAILAARVP